MDGLACSVRLPVNPPVLPMLAKRVENPGQRGEQIAEALGTDTKTMRLPMQKLIAHEKGRTKGERRGMRYYPPMTCSRH
jgi:hypothetical protein